LWQVCEQSGIRALILHFGRLQLEFQRALRVNTVLLLPGDVVVVSGDAQAGTIRVRHRHGSAVIHPGWLGAERETLKPVLPAVSTCTPALRPYLEVATLAAQVVGGLGLEVDVRRGRMGVGGTFMLVVPDKGKSTYRVKVRTVVRSAAHVSGGGMSICVLRMKTNSGFSYTVHSQSGDSDGGWRTKGTVQMEGEVVQGHGVYRELLALNTSVRRGGGVDSGKWQQMEKALRALVREQRQGAAINAVFARAPAAPAAAPAAPVAAFAPAPAAAPAAAFAPAPVAAFAAAPVAAAG
jgi:hypothetical protein